MSFMLGGVGIYPFSEGGLRGNVHVSALSRWTQKIQKKWFILDYLLAQTLTISVRHHGG
jgi:hypothetical protein